MKKNYLYKIIDRSVVYLTQNANFIKAIALLVLGVIALSSSSIFFRWLISELSPSAAVFNRFMFAAIVFGLWSVGKLLRQQLSQDIHIEPQSYNIQTLWLLLGAGISLTATLLLIVWSLTQTSVAITSVLHNLIPLFTSLGAWLLLNRSFNGRFLFGMAVALVGMVTIEWGELHLATSNIQGDIAAILSAVTMAAYLMCVEHLRSKFSAVTVQLWVCGSGALMMLPILLLTQDRLFATSTNAWFYVVCLTLVCQVFGQGCLTYSLERLSSVSVSLVHLLEPLFSGILAWSLFGETLSFFHQIGFVVILSGLGMIIISQVTPELIPVITQDSTSQN